MNARPGLTEAPIPQLVRRIAVPASVGYLFSTLYNAVDTWCAGLLSTRALAALSLSLPVFFVIIAVGTGISSGATALIAAELGAGRRDRAGLLATQALVLGQLVAVGLLAAGLLGAPLAFTALGAEGEVHATAVAYMAAIFAGTPLFLLVYSFNAVLNAVGETRPFRNFLIAGAALNALLDPWFAFGGWGLPAFGVTGIACTTVMIQGLGCAYLGVHAARTGLLGRGSRAAWVPRMPQLRELARQGVPAAANLLTVGLGIFVITYFVARFGEAAVAAYGAAMRVEQLVLLPAIGLNVATLTLVAQNDGAGQPQRAAQAVGVALRYGAALLVPGAVLVIALARPLLGVFSSDPAVLDVGTAYLRIDALALYAYVVLFVYVAALQGVRRPMFGLWLGLSRQILAPLAVFHVLVGVLGVGLTGIWWGIFAITWAAAGVATVYARSVLRGRAGQALAPEGGLR